MPGGEARPIKKRLGSMEETVKGQVVGHHDEQQLRAKIIELFIINSKNEMLLHKAQGGQASKRAHWEVPYLGYDQTTQTPLEAAQEYLTGLGMVSDLYEAFTINDAQSPDHKPPAKGGRVIIAFVNADQPDLHFATDAYKWILFQTLLKNVHDDPSHYARWFRSALEGVALYLKNGKARKNNKSHAELTELP